MSIKAEKTAYSKLLPAILIAMAVFLTFAVYDGDLLAAVNREFSREVFLAAVNSLLPYSFMRWVVFIAITSFAYRFPLRVPSGLQLMLSFLYSLFMISGLGMSKLGSFSAMFSSFGMAALGIMIYVLTYITLLWLIELLCCGYELLLSEKLKKRNVFLEKLFGDGAQWKLPMILFAVWLPLAILRYPAGIEKDAYYQINQFLGTLQIIDSNPPFSTALIGGFFWLGKHVLASIELGAFIFVLFQSMFCAMVLSYSLRVMYHAGVNSIYLFTVLFIYTFIPLYSGYITSVIKDTPFAISVVLLVSALADHSVVHNKSLKQSVLIAAAAALVSLLRHTGIFIVIIYLIVYLFEAAVKKDRRAFFAPVCLVCGLLAWAVLTPLLTNIFKVEHIENGAREILSIPLQQTANYCRNYPDEVSDDEKRVISSVLDYDLIVEKFDISLSDPVKATWYGSKDDVREYTKVYFTQFSRHPGCYLDAFLGLNYGYFYPSVKQFSSVNSGMYKTVWNTEGIVFTVPAKLEPVREAVMGLTMIVENSPLFYPFCCVALYSWLMIYLFIRCITKKDKSVLKLLLPCFLWMIGCLNVPTFFQNGIRYALPYIWPMYLLTGLCLFIPESKKLRGA